MTLETYDASYKLCQADLTFISSQLAFVNGDNLTSLALNDQSIKMLTRIDAGNANLTPLMVGTGNHIDMTDNDTLAFDNGLEGLKKSLKKEKGNKRLLAFASRFASFQAIIADKMKMPNLAEAYFNYAISICDEYDISGYKNSYYCFLAVLKASQGKRKEALETLEKAKMFISKDPITQKEDQLITFGYTGKVYGLLEDYKVSEDSYRKAFQIAKEIGTSQLIYTAEIGIRRSS
ncbi:MAG: tetratricopeptide repeat protein [Blastocatellia bacterium]|nr:tetratricopeptide repeat protein [Blastocatellia bacterium]